MDPQFYHRAIIGIFATSAILFPFLFFISAPYGRHIRPGWGPAISSRLAWLVMEIPSPVAFFIFYLRGDNWAELAPMAICAMYMTHYIHRTLVYPLRMRGDHTKPVLTVLMAIIFNTFNGMLNGWAISAMAPYLTDAWLTDPRFLIGVTIFVIGYVINHRSDAILRRLRSPGDSGYHIPNDGLHRLVASPNYLGEIIEWGGFALAASTGPALAFFVFTLANLAPRARSNLLWYRATFADYPPARKALIPHVW